jgi:hypothetical protein
VPPQKDLIEDSPDVSLNVVEENLIWNERKSYNAYVDRIERDAQDSRKHQQRLRIS